MANKGIDISIAKLVTRFSAKLFVTNDCDWFGRIYRNVRNDGIIPERYISGNEYRDVLPNDKKDLTCFFDVQPDESVGVINVANVSICFSVNLKTLYPTISDVRATEYIHEDILRQINKIGGWKVDGLVRGLPAFSDYAMVKDSDNLHPYYLFRFNAVVKYPYEC